MPPKADAPASNVPPAANKEDTIPPSSNGTKVTQRFTDPSPAAQTSPGTICPNCGHRNRPGTLICDNCGTSLISGTKSAVGTRDLVSATEAAAASSEPLMDAAQLNAVESAGGSLFTDDMVLRIEIEGGATPMLVYPKQEIILGRRDPNTGTLPDVDMTAYSGYRMGVSRTHASIRLQDKQLNLSDRGSSNGTFLNGTRLVAHRPYPIKDGDEIRLGQMVLKIYFQSNKNRK
ncbi:MAG: FHA domain-containing protein [Anaerolineaceae bacterium]|nr:FHA domain-containing protein [Anaerolineaceae bacterium]